ncbi:MAG: hypothetical protein K8T90_14895 [Planctomycetes bacterium]|nr:hypothetical protein [Planctomycetota bacterium]
MITTASVAFSPKAMADGGGAWRVAPRKSYSTTWICATGAASVIEHEQARP